MSEEKIIKGPLPVVDYPYPYHFDGITDDEKCFEHFYLMLNYDLFAEKKYKPLIRQLLDGDISEVPIEYLKYCLSYARDNTWQYNLETYYQNHGKV